MFRPINFPTLATVIPLTLAFGFVSGARSQPAASPGPAISSSSDVLSARALHEEAAYRQHSELAASYRQQKQLERAAFHARAAFDALRQWHAAAPLAEKDAATRDDLFYRSAALLSDIQLEMKHTGEAITALQELRRVSVHLPSIDLYRRASILLGRIVPPVGLMIAPGDALFSAGRRAPEIAVKDWLDQSPTTLTNLRGRVVLLDFWSLSCAPCRVALPHLKAWQEKYRKDLSVIAFTQYEQELKPEHQRSELRRLRRAWRLPFGFAIADTYETARRYRVSTTPAAVLIDRRGVVRYLSIGAKDTDIEELEQMLAKLIDEAGR